MAAYRSWRECREIAAAIIAESAPKPLSAFGLTQTEETFFRARSQRALDALAQKTATFKAYYDLPVRKPFRNVLAASAVMILAVAAAAGIFYLHLPEDADATPLFTGSVAVAAAAVGWVVAGSITHRNTIRQNTNNMLFARFTQAPFGEALYRFHKEFGYDAKISIKIERYQSLRSSTIEEEIRTASSMIYLLNYFEFIANGVLKGDLDASIIRDNFRGVINFYSDKCWPYILAANKINSKTYDGLIRLRTHYREP